MLKPLRIFRQHGDCHPEVRQFTARSLLPFAVITGPPPQGSVSLRPSRCYAVLESVSLQDWCLFYTALETLTSCCYGRGPTVGHSFIWMDIELWFWGQKEF